MHLENYCFVRQQDYSAPEPPQKHSPEAFLGWLAKQLKLAREVVVCYEAGCFGYEPARPMQAMGARVLVLAPQNWDEQGKRQVNDKFDARVMCRRLSDHLDGHRHALSLVRIPSREEEQRRSVGRQREQLRKLQRQTQAMGRSLLLRHEVAVCGPWWRGRAWGRLAKSLPELVIAQLEHDRAVLVVCEKEAAALEAPLTAEAKPEERFFGEGALTHELLARIGEGVPPPISCAWCARTASKVRPRVTFLGRCTPGRRSRNWRRHPRSLRLGGEPRSTHGDETGVGFGALFISSSPAHFIVVLAFGPGRRLYGGIMTRSLLALVALALGMVSANAETQVLKWKDGMKAVFILSFDDSCQSQLNNVVPELNKRKLTGTFYLVMGGGVHAARQKDWEAAVKSPYIVEANHTFNHKGVKSVEELESELAKNNDALYALHPERKAPRLLAWGRPGGVPWEITEEQELAGLAKNHLLRRPSFYGPPIHYKSAEECLAAIDKALAKGDMGHLDMHGVGGDWLKTPLEWFTAICDKLEANRDTIWSADALSYMEYKAERETAEVKEVENTPARIRVSLTSKMDLALYDQPLTLATKVPAAWKSCVVTQGAKKTTVEVRDGNAQYDAVPGAGEIALASS